MKIKDKIVVVTGGADGIGKALCERFHKEGAAGIVVADHGSTIVNAATSVGADRKRNILTVAIDARTGEQRWSASFDGKAGKNDRAVGIARCGGVEGGRQQRRQLVAHESPSSSGARRASGWKTTSAMYQLSPITNPRSKRASVRGEMMVRARFIPIVYQFFVVNIALFWLLLSAGIATVTVARVFFVWVSVFNLFAVAVFWSFMADLFHKGAFQGATKSEAYFVRCDASTTTPLDQEKGIVNLIVGFAPLKPAEFLVISIQQIPARLEV